MWKTLKIEKDKDQGQDKKIWKRDQRENKIKNQDQKNKLKNDFFNFTKFIHFISYVFIMKTKFTSNKNYKAFKLTN